MATIELEHLTKVYADGTCAVDKLDLSIADGEFIVFVGPSGCGKTSALRMTAGLEEISDGTLRVGGEIVNDIPPKDRDIAMIFQNYALYPHMNVQDNLGFGLKMRGVPKTEIAQRVDQVAGVLGLAELLKKRPRHLSGGQRQRVAMGRAIVRQPQAFLMDEPLSNLDAKLRVQMRAEISRIQRELRVTTIYVTHDQSEAMTLADRVCMLRSGVLQQVDEPHVLYDRPANLFVAGFIGSPAMNLVEAEISRNGNGMVATFGPHALNIPEAVLADHSELKAYAGKRVALGIRPEDLMLPESDSVPSGLLMDVSVEMNENMGAEVLVHFQVDATRVRSDALQAAVGEALEVDSPNRTGAPFIARLERGSRARAGDALRLAVRPDRMHFFDLATGAGIYGE
jgi:multiple sugar transport system ATP-binding protein